jgi:serine/threonine protein kinase
MRPAGALQVDGKAIVTPKLEPLDGDDADTAPVIIPNEPAVLKNSSDDSGSSVAVRLGSGELTVPAQPAQEQGLISRHFGSYEIMNEISRGSFGVVYKAQQQGLDRVVALKVLLAGAHASQEAVARFQREAKSVARLKHPNIVPVYDIGTQDGHHYFAMEFIEGSPLSALITNKTVTSSDALAIAEQLADALESAHKAGVIHRDIKPSNILVDAKGTPNITDFGLAKQIDLDTKYTVSGTTLGTPAYMPPEQARGEIEKIDARSDVYSLGAVIYEMLTGRTPFVGRSLLEVVVAVINDPLTPPRALNPKIHRDVQTIIQKCLEKDPRQRYASAADLRDDIRRFRSGEAIRARPAGILRVTGRFVKRHSALIAAIAVVLIAVGISVDRVRKSNETVIAVKKDLEAEKKEKRSREVQWIPDWWFGLKKLPDNATEEQRARYTIPPGREAHYERMVAGKNVPDLVNGQLTITPGSMILVSPDECRFFGDVEADVVFRLNENGVANGFRIGLQSSSSKEYDGIPYLAEYKGNRLRLIGPVDLYVHTTSEAEKGPPRLEVKAEKEVSELISGDYTVKIHREGLNLSFQVVGPKLAMREKIEIRDLNLSNWVFKNTQLAVRTPPGAGMEVVSAEVRRKFGGDEEPAFAYFRLGEYNVAERDLQVLAGGEDPMKKAHALYQLGMIQEIYHAPQADEYRRKYADASLSLDRLRESKEAVLDAARRLKREIQLRTVMSFARDRNWEMFKRELGRVSERVGEPLGWELQSALEQAVKSPAREHSLDAAVLIMQRLGLRPGSARIAGAAKELALILANDNPPRYDDLIAIHSAHPAQELHIAFFKCIERSAQTNQIPEAYRLLQYITPFVRTDADAAMLSANAALVVSAAMKMHKYTDAAKVVALVKTPDVITSFSDDIERQVKELAAEEFEPFVKQVLPVAAAAVPDDAEASRRLTEALDKLARTMISIGRITEIMDLHEVLRGKEAKSDARLAGAFAEAVKTLSNMSDDDSQALARDLLRYCAEHVTIGDRDLQKATLALAEPHAVLNDNRYARILTIQRAYPSPDLLPLSARVMEQLMTQQLYQDAIFFYMQARTAFKAEARLLRPQAINSLSAVKSEDQRAHLLNALWFNVHGDFEAAGDEDSDRLWKLEFGDILLAMNIWEKARDVYQQIYTTPKMPPELVGRAGLRLAALYYIHPDTTDPAEILPALLAMDNLPDEIKLAVRLLAANDVKMDELDKHMKDVNAPTLLSAGEWDLFRGMHMRMANNPPGATAALLSAQTKSGDPSAWYHIVASQLSRATGRNSPDETPPPETAPPGPKIGP